VISSYSVCNLTRRSTQRNYQIERQHTVQYGTLSPRRLWCLDLHGPPYLSGLIFTLAIIKNVSSMVVVAAICPNRRCAASVLVPRTDATLNITNSRKRFRLMCFFCRSRFRVSPSDLVVRRVSPVWLLIRFDQGDSVAGLYLNQGERRSSKKVRS
jgi:hypothetical protein